MTRRRKNSKSGTPKTAPKDSDSSKNPGVNVQGANMDGGKSPVSRDPTGQMSNPSKSGLNPKQYDDDEGTWNIQQPVDGEYPDYVFDPPSDQVVGSE